MRSSHKPGDIMEMDWAGDTIVIFNSETGEEDEAYLFVAALPCSFYFYAELTEDMRLENWILCHLD